MDVATKYMFKDLKTDEAGMSTFGLFPTTSLKEQVEAGMGSKEHLIGWDQKYWILTDTCDL